MSLAINNNMRAQTATNLSSAANKLTTGNKINIAENANNTVAQTANNRISATTIRINNGVKVDDPKITQALKDAQNFQKVAEASNRANEFVRSGIGDITTKYGVNCGSLYKVSDNLTVQKTQSQTVGSLINIRG